MASDERKYDKNLKIQTTGRDTRSTNQYRYPYEPTPYSVLERLTQSGFLANTNTLIDFGCGKGRVSFYFSHVIGCNCVGIEYDPDIYQTAVLNRKKAVSGKKTTFVLGDAAQFKIPRNADRCFFFNPFSVEILEQVIYNLTTSYSARPRQIYLFFYYPEDDYLDFLHNDPRLSYVKEINCMDLFPDPDVRETIQVFKYQHHIYKKE